MSYEVGKLYMYIGPMYSGKTSKLVSVYKKYLLNNIQPLVINYIGDDRYPEYETHMSTHDGLKIPCKRCETLKEINMDEHDIILINEGQFFKDLKDCVIDLVTNKQKQVYVAGLDGDFQQNPIGDILYLIPFADKVVKLSAICRCTSKAIFSHRLTSETSQICIGSTNYIPLCRKCLKNI